jgi:general secretion pathway protein D
MQSKSFPVAALLLAISLSAAAQPPAPATAELPSPGVRQTELRLSPQPAPERPPLDPDRPIFDVFAVIERLADEMDKEFIVDPRVSRQALGWSTSGDDADYETLLAVLRTMSYAAIEVGDQIRILPEAIARAEPSRILQQDDSRVSDHAVVTRVIDVADIEFAVEGGTTVSAAPQLVPMLRPLMSTQIGSIGTIPGTSKIILVDRYDNVRRITAIIDVLRP